MYLRHKYRIRVVGILLVGCFLALPLACSSVSTEKGGTGTPVSDVGAGNENPAESPAGDNAGTPIPNNNGETPNAVPGLVVDTMDGPTTNDAGGDVTPVPGACCQLDGSCAATTRDECDGAFAGDGVACSASSCEVSPFTDEAVERGIDYLAVFPRGGSSVPGAGLGFFDFDNDGDADLMTLGRVGDGRVGVFENDGTGRFTDRSMESGITPRTEARGITGADYDADGDIDIFISMWLVPSILLRNDGGFHFTDVTAEAGVGVTLEGTGCTWGDYDGDGWVDLYASSYGTELPNHLFRNLGNGTFNDVGEALGVASLSRTMQAAFLDIDGDADLDLYVANDLQGFICPDCCNELFINNHGTYTLASPANGANACLQAMCVAIGDVNNDLTPDLFFTDSLGDPGNTLITYQGNATYADSSAVFGVKTPGEIGWGAAFFDYTNNGYEDLYVLHSSAANALFENHGTTPLLNVAPAIGIDNANGGSSYCVASADIDNDGDLDVAMETRQQTIHLYINHEGNKRRWVKFNVAGEGANTMGIGTTVTISAGGRRQVRQNLTGKNLKSQDFHQIHFGLDTARVLDEITVVWPSRATRSLTRYAGNQTWTLYPPVRLGDADGNGSIDVSDLALLDDCFGRVEPGCEMMDFDGDGDVDNADAEQATQ